MNEIGKIIVIYDCPWEVCDKRWLYEELKKTEETVKLVTPGCLISQVELKGKKGKILAMLLTLSECIKAMRVSKKGDLVVCWSQWSGLFFNLLPGAGKRKIISFNWLTPTINKKTRYIYAKALNNPNLVAIINSKDNLKKLLEDYNVDNKHNNIHYIPDVFDDQKGFYKPQWAANGTYGFIGGRANRDWELFFEVAKRCGNILFHAVASRADWDNNWKCPDNVTLHFDLTEEDYKKLLQEAYVVMIPLKEDKVSGLVNILKSVQLGKVVLTTKIPVTEEYFPDNLRRYLAEKGNVDQWCRNLEEVFSFNEEAYVQYVENMQFYIRDNFSPQKAGEEVRKIIEEYGWKY